LFVVEFVSGDNDEIDSCNHRDVAGQLKERKKNIIIVENKKINKGKRETYSESKKKNSGNNCQHEQYAVSHERSSSVGKCEQITKDLQEKEEKTKRKIRKEQEKRKIVLTSTL
jgi:hypothetical protein